VKYAEAKLVLKADNATFLADAMLGNIARKLRIFGFDTLYVAHASDDKILEAGITHNRVILTADRELFKRIVKAGAKGVLVSCTDDVEDLVHILTKNGIRTLNMNCIGSRCSVCNGTLASRTYDQVYNIIPNKVAKSCHEFYQCIECGKIYWEGSHFKRIMTLAKRVESKLANTALPLDISKG
jgi:uncharacterized protein with PIN domain